jgi:dihydrofolate synthase/folylpolyglutamate synthase
MLAALRADRADLLIACTPDSPRAIPAPDVAAVARTVPVVTEVAHDVGDAVARALAIAADEDAVLVTGSLYVAGAARAMLPGLLEGRDAAEPDEPEDEPFDPDDPGEPA